VNSMTTQTCTVVVTAEGDRCGKPAVATFKSRAGVTYGECADCRLDVPANLLLPLDKPVATHPKTRTTAPYVLVSRGNGFDLIVGYAHSTNDRVMKRASRLNAEIVPVQR